MSARAHVVQHSVFSVRQPLAAKKNRERLTTHADRSSQKDLLALQQAKEWKVIKLHKLTLQLLTRAFLLFQ